MVHNCHGIFYFNKQYKIESKNNNKTITMTRKKWKGPSSRNASKDINWKKIYIYTFVISSPFPWHWICNDLHVEEAVKAKSLPQLKKKKKNWEHDDWLRRSFSVSELRWKLTDGISWSGERNGSKSVGFIPPKGSISQNLPLLKLSNFERGNLYDLLTLLHCFSPLDGKWHAENTVTTHFGWKK